LDKKEICMKHKYYDIENTNALYASGDAKCNYRFIEPPIIVYYVTTTDQYGNINVAPISLGTHMGFGDGNSGGLVGYCNFSLIHKATGRGEDAPTATMTAPRDTGYNLDQNGQCVISYATARQLKEMRITGCPVPTGIDEGEIAGFHYYPSVKVAPPCIDECPVNMEATVVFSKVFGHVKMYVCKIMALHVEEYYDKLDKDTRGHPGLILTHPLFEIYQEGDVFFGNDADDKRENLRMKLATMGPHTPLVQEPSDIGHGDTKKALTEWIKKIVRQ
jgi:flavin reductase (DIM6/NTAB) family NADH-FMN oxidoreductase RutF